MASAFDKTLEMHATDLASAVQLLVTQCREADLGLSDGSSIPYTGSEARMTGTVGNILDTLDRILRTVFQLAPNNFVQHLVSQSQLLACIQWLGEFQVLPYIPLSGNSAVSIKDLADLADVPEAQLCRVVRNTAMAGFLSEPQPGYIEHTALSAAFIAKPAHLDATMFLAETAAPSALHMAAATKLQAPSAMATPSVSTGYSAYTLSLSGAHNEAQTFQSALEHRKRIQRQWCAYLGYVGDSNEAATELLGQLDWAGLGNSCVVDVEGSWPLKGKCPVLALAERYPTLRFIVQMEEPPTSFLPAATPADIAGRISVQCRASGTPQTVNDAAVYMVRLPTSGSLTLRERILAELRAHQSVLRNNRTALLILTPHVLPEPGAVATQVERMARSRDLSLLQLANEGDLGMQEVMDLVDSVSDGTGRLVVVKKLRSWNSAIVALGIRYQPQHQVAPLQ